MYLTRWCLHQGAPFKRDPRPYFCLSVSPLSHPNRVPLPGHAGGGKWGRKVNQGSWIYRWQTSLPPWAPVSSMRLWPLGGMGLMLGLCVRVCVYIYIYICVGILVCDSVWCSSSYNRKEQSSCPAFALHSTAGAGWTRVLNVVVQCHGEDVWKKRLVNSNTVAELHFYTCAPHCSDFPPKCPTDL